jgi:internalin A
MIADQKVKRTLALSAGWWLASTSVGICQPTREYKTFAQWCQNLSQLSAQEKETVEFLLKEAKTQDCNLADRKLIKITDLYLSIVSVDLKPISTLTNLTELTIEHNAISNFQAISKLTNLKSLYLRNNQVSDITPLSNLKKLTELTLRDQKISDITPLHQLTNLTNLELRENQI